MKHPDRLFTEAEVKRLLRAITERARRGTLLDRIDHALITFGCSTSGQDLPVGSNSGPTFGPLKSSPSEVS